MSFAHAPVTKGLVAVSFSSSLRIWTVTMHRADAWPWSLVSAPVYIRSQTLCSSSAKATYLAGPSSTQVRVCITLPPSAYSSHSTGDYWHITSHTRTQVTCLLLSCSYTKLQYRLSAHLVPLNVRSYFVEWRWAFVDFKHVRSRSM